MLSLRVRAALVSMRSDLTNRLVRFSIKSNNNNRIIYPETAKAFAKIPGPEPSKIGDYFQTGDTVESLQKLHNDFGDIVKIEVAPKVPTVFLFSTHGYKDLCHVEGDWPVREASPCQEFYAEFIRKRHGLVTSQNAAWRKLRTQANKSLGSVKVLNSFVEGMHDVTSDFVNQMQLMRNPNSFEMPANFLNHISRWALESICLIALGERIGCMGKDESCNDDAQKMIVALREMFDQIHVLDNSPVELSVHSPQLQPYYDAMETILGFADKYMEKAMQRFACKLEGELNHQPSMLERLFLGMDREMATVMLQDLLAGGVDTVKNTVAKAMYLIACHPVEQEKLAQELQRVLPEKNSQVTAQTLQEVPYLKACVNETMRLFPATEGSLRTMREDGVLAGYSVPRGVRVVACHSIMSTRPEYFSDPRRFVPDRWIGKKGDDMYPTEDVLRFGFRPFGTGVRSCIAQRLAKYEMLIVTAKVVRNFYLEWNHKPLKMVHHHISFVESPLKIKVLDRTK